MGSRETLARGAGRNSMGLASRRMPSCTATAAGCTQRGCCGHAAERWWAHQLRLPHRSSRELQARQMRAQCFSADGAPCGLSGCVVGVAESWRKLHKLRSSFRPNHSPNELHIAVNTCRYLKLQVGGRDRGTSVLRFPQGGVHTKAWHSRLGSRRDSAHCSSGVQAGMRASRDR